MLVYFWARSLVGPEPLQVGGPGILPALPSYSYATGYTGTALLYGSNSSADYLYD